MGLTDFAGLHILEIGPLEAAHTYRLEQMGAASVTCVEASAEAWLKCLVVKELLGLNRSKFLLGDAMGFLEAELRRFDVVFCSGVLYHMSDPIRLIRAIAGASDRCFVWTHVYHPDRHPVPFEASSVEREGVTFDYWTHRYGSKEALHWGGIDPTAAWLTKEDVLRAFSACGLSAVNFIEDQANHPNGPAIMFTASRP
ncbi:class I SAM-dependent methyltransferase [Lichenifustis flavocetrariae]|uniref:Class I SAM-dependent methyltransferase n=1 Tax=Lichenifustis flavocetrariae TaxID=2949735 RepID=A0AA41Z9V8_9HYPH|nr:class I SAM-dependent methyltransferase [Lichenifustis flavocetrariae]MCW6511952.1 class I SAM-dependent methyltransferase [Lichenifustis flavocetrariae]